MDRDERGFVVDTSARGAVGAAISGAFLGGMPMNMQYVIRNMEEK